MRKDLRALSLQGISFVLAAVVILLCLSGQAAAKIYIDITSPAFRQVPLAVPEFTGQHGRELADIVRNDLDFTGLFLLLDRSTFIESSSQPFNPKNWSVVGADLVLKGTTVVDKTIASTVILYDVSEGREIFRKQYQAEPSLIRPLAHTIANDIYKQITNENGVFKTRIAYVVRQKALDELALMDWDGYRSVKPGVKGAVLLGPRWARDGSRLLYSSERNREWGVYLLDFARQSEKKVFSGKGTNLAGDFFPNGNEFVLSSSTAGSQDIYTYSLPQAKLTRITSSRSIDVSPAVSPDGELIVFVSDRQGTPQIFTVGRDGFDARRVTFQGTYNTSPAWSPKADKIAFSGRQNGKNQIFVINPDGSGLTQLTDRGNNEDPSFSPDGRYIVFTSDREGEKAVYLMRANGEAQKRITPKGVRAFGPRWSPS